MEEGVLPDFKVVFTVLLTSFVNIHSRSLEGQGFLSHSSGVTPMSGFKPVVFPEEGKELGPYMRTHSFLKSLPLFILISSFWEARIQVMSLERGTDIQSTAGSVPHHAHMTELI